MIGKQHPTIHYSRSRLLELLPKDKFDIESVDTLTSIGFPILNQVLPEMLEWTQDLNWPVALPVSLLLSHSGAEILPHILRILKSDDEEWILSLNESLFPNFDSCICRQISESIDRNFAIELLSESAKTSIDVFKTKAQLCKNDFPTTP